MKDAMTLRTISLYALAALASAETSFERGRYIATRKCTNTLNDDQIEEISTDDWQLSYKFTIPGLAECTYTTESTAFLYWDDSQLFTIRY